MTTAADGQKAFRLALQSRKFDSTYYIFGEDEHLKQEAVRQLLAVAVDPATEAFNLDQLHGSDVQGEALGVMLGTPPMMAERRVVVIRQAGALRKDARLALDRYVAAPPSDTLLILVAALGEKPDKQLLALGTAVEYAPLSGTQLPKWIAQQVERAGNTISEKATSLLLDSVGNDLTLLALELEKLAAFTGGEPISEDAVAAVVGARREETLGHLLDAVAERNALAALDALPRVLQQPKMSGVTVVMALAVQTLALAWGSARGFAAMPHNKEYYNLLKSGGAPYTGRAWSEAVSTWSRHSRRWATHDLDAALRALAEADQALKGSGISSDEQVLSTLILALCRTTERRSAA